ncbi:GNAT family N-acetyltransferase [Methanoregula sp.]|uniref:lipid II:glycine glycyltransferase FemX n=1 Tax=Methanoregula sp. TaxID=2052170 RepID=UPI00261AF70C|nr:GNAT family N-acetyltransferase [Methanoregula sp.]MDD5141895.1 GNAT family N-acetyltransferase [Methanoregula sp.]
MLLIINDISDCDWNKFVDSHPQGNVYQHSSIFEIYKNTKNYEPVRFALLEVESKTIKGVIQGVIIKEMNNVFSQFSSRAIIFGGPLISSDLSKKYALDLIQNFDDEVKKRTIYTEIRNLFEMKDTLDTIPDYSFIEHLNFLINLDRTENELWKSIHKDRRKNITRSEKYGLVFEEMKDDSKMDIFYSLLKTTYTNVQIPLADKSLFLAAMKLLVPSGHAKFFLARYEDRYIGARAILLYNKTIYDWYAGASLEDLSNYPNEFLVWNILKWGIQNNYSRFDFGGAGDPNKPYGPREFKRRFGGDLVNFGRFTKIHKPHMMKITQYGFELYRKIVYK